MKRVVFGTFCFALVVLLFMVARDGAGPVPGPVEQGEARPGDFWMYQQRTWPNGRLKEEAVARGARQAQVMRETGARNKNQSSWIPVAPTGVPGRVTQLAQEGNTLYATTPDSGLWRLDEGARTWRPLFDNMPTQSIGSVAVASNDVLYAGTGDANGGFYSALRQGLGIFKTEDGGKTWRNMGLEKTRSIGRVVLHPENPNLIYAAAMGSFTEPGPDRGLYRSQDGGVHWEKILFIDEVTGCIDVVIDPDQPQRIYAATWERTRTKYNVQNSGPGSGLWRSDDGGDTWEPMTQGLPETDDLGRVGLTVAPSNPNILYAVFVNHEERLEGVYKSENKGDTWRRLNTENAEGMDNIYSNFGWFFGKIRVHPFNPDHVFALGVWTWLSRDGGTTWSRYQDTLPDDLAENPLYQVHVDFHDMLFSGDQGIVNYVATDGGIYRSDGPELIWTAMETPPSAQFYSCEIDPSNPDVFYGGLQDNGIKSVRDGNSQWSHWLTGDGMGIQVDPTNGSSIFMGRQRGRLHHVFSRQIYPLDPLLGENERFAWKSPIMLDPQDPKTLYVGSQRLWRITYETAGEYEVHSLSDDLSDGSGEEDASTQHVLTTLNISPVDSRIIYAGTDDGNAWATHDGGETWRQFSSLPKRWVTSAATDPEDPNTAYFTFSGYYEEDDQPYVMMTRDQGDTWTNITGNLPAAPVNDLVVDPTNPEILYLAGDYGVYYTTNRGASWKTLGVGLPMVTVIDLELDAGTDTLAAATFGRSLFKIYLDEPRADRGSQGSEKPYQYLIPEVWAGDERRSQVTLVNPGETATAVELVLFDRHGARMRGYTYDLDPRQKATREIEEPFPGLTPAWVQVGSDLPIHVMLEMGDAAVLSAYQASDPSHSMVYIPHIAKNTAAFETVISSVNGVNQNMNSRIFANLDGPKTPIREHQTAFAAMTRDARYYLGGILDQVDFAILEADGPGTGTMERFTTLPEQNQTASLGLNGQSGKTLRFLHIAENNQLFWTGIAYINVSDETASVEEVWYNRDGELLSTRPIQLESGRKVTLLRDSLGSEIIPADAAWMEVRSNQDLAGYELFGSNTGTGHHFFAGLQGHYETGTTLDYLHLAGDDRTWTSLVAVNLGDAPADLTLTAYDQDGQILESKTVEAVAPGRKLAVLTNDFFSPETNAANAWVRATGPDSQWAGFQLWGDHNNQVREGMAGINAYIHP